MPGQRLTFRIKFWRAWLGLAISYQFIALVLAGGVAVYGATIGWKPWEGLGVWVVLGGCASVMSLVHAVTRVWWAPVRVDAAALDCFDLLGTPVAIGWASVKSVRRLTLFGFPYLKITSQTHPDVLWLPLALANMDAFTEAVCEFAGPDHPVTEALFAELGDA